MPTPPNEQPRFPFPQAVPYDRTIVTTSLPDDVVLKIFLWLDVEDVLQFSLTCRKLHSLTHVHWVHRYHSLCARLPRPMLPESLDALSTKELAQVVIRMARLQRNWTSEQPSTKRRATFLAEMTGLPEGQVPEPLGRGQALVTMKLLPGGRWLLTFMRFGVILWDLNAADVSQSAQLLITGSMDIRSVAVDSKGAPESFKVAFMTNPIRQEARLHLFQVAAQPVATFTLLKTLTLQKFAGGQTSLHEGSFSFMTLNADFRLAGTVNVLDWQASAPGGWLVGTSVSSGNDGYYGAKILPENRILLTSIHKLVICEIPPFSAFSTTEPQSPILQLSIWTQDLNTPRLFRGDSMTLLPPDQGPSGEGTSCVISFSTYECQYLLSVPVSKNSPLVVEKTFAPEQSAAQKAQIDRRKGNRERQIGRHRGVWDLDTEGIVLFSDHGGADGNSRVFQRVSHDRFRDDEGNTEARKDQLPVVQVCLDEVRGRVCIRFGTIWDLRNYIEIWDFV